MGMDFSNKREGELGQEATIAEFTEPGGIAGRMSNSFNYADTSMVLVTIKSNPAGFIAESITSPSIQFHRDHSKPEWSHMGSHFAYWTIDGVRQYGPTGVSQSKVSDVITADTVFTAHYIPSNEDTDGDGVKDWFEMYQFGSLGLGPDDDPDGDGFSNKRENLGRRQPLVSLWRREELPAECPIVSYYYQYIDATGRRTASISTVRLFL